MPKLPTVGQTVPAARPKLPVLPEDYFWRLEAEDRIWGMIPIKLMHYPRGRWSGRRKRPVVVVSGNAHPALDSIAHRAGRLYADWQESKRQAAWSARIEGDYPPKRLEDQ